jgi:AraC-like DNA-binding protein
VDEVRCDMAKVYLKDRFSISEISFYLDYSDQAAFSTAFKRWMGCSPKEYQVKQGS